jgi:YbbR domain-containing protein
LLSKRTISNNLSLKIAAVVVALVLWLFAKGEQTVDQLLSIPLVLRNVPEGLTTLTRPPEDITVVFSGDMKELIKLRIWGEPYAVIDMSEAAADRALRVGLSAANVILPRDAEVQILEVRDPKSLDIEVEALEERKVKVKPAIVGELADGYHMLAGATSVPDSVTLYGPRAVVRAIESVTTASLSISGRRSRAEAARRVEFDGEWNLHAVPKDVRVIVEVEGTEVMTLRHVEVDFRYEPGFSSANIEPTTVELEVSGPEHIVTRLTPEDVVVLIDARGLPRGLHQLVPDVDAPDRVEVVSTTPVRFTVTLQ